MLSDVMYDDLGGCFWNFGIGILNTERSVPRQRREDKGFMYTE